MKFENTSVTGFEASIRGARNPLQSWAKSDSGYKDGVFVLGANDIGLMQRLINGDLHGNGEPNSKFLRMIHVSVDITAPMYWWSECDTYKVGTTANSTSKMHKLASTPITVDCFEMDDFNKNFGLSALNKDGFDISDMWEFFIDKLETLRCLYNETKDKRYWKELIRLLPESWLQKRTFDCDYSTLRNMYYWRKSHKLNEWSGKDKTGVECFCKWVESLPYAKELICYEGVTK